MFFEDTAVLSAIIDYDENNNIFLKSYGSYNLSYSNTYDEDGNIIADENNQYTYDTAGELTSVTGNSNSSYTYDSRGNILSKTVNGETTAFLYNTDEWKDQLISVGGEALTYDDNGNLVSYDGKEYSWSHGKRLESVTDGENKYYYSYDSNGIRTSKTYGDTTTYFTTVDGAITSQYELDENNNVINLIEFIYDSSNDVIGFIYDNNTYFYIKNVQGDIISIADSDGNVLVDYYYHTWGYSSFDDYSDNDLASINPMRFKGYYEDTEIGFCYLQSRYYVPELFRFLNSDLPTIAQEHKDEINGLNLFAYCGNDPVNNADLTGYWGADIHYGKEKNKGKYGYYDGTYEWMTKGSHGICLISYFATAIAKGDQDVDNNPNTTPTKKGKTDTKLAERQKYHFNRNTNNQTDSRLEEGRKWFNDAVTQYNNAVNEYNKKIKQINGKYFNKNSAEYKKEVDMAKKRLKTLIYNALFTFGKALHCYQDIYAHGNISAGPVTKFYRDRIFGHAFIDNVDNPYYNWINKSKTKVDEYIVKGKMTLSPRYYDTKKKTISLYEDFKDKVKESKYLKNSFKW